MANHSCESQLLLTVDDLARAVDKTLQVDCSILDFSKAFNKVLHARLIHKLNYHGINRNLLSWIKAFLMNCSQQIKVNDFCLSPRNVLSGVPQGSVLGPVLFLIFINDIIEHVDSQISLLADDCLMYRIIHSPEDHTILQKDLTLLTNWYINVKWCKLLHVDISRFTYTMNNIPLEFVDQHNYLGVCLHNKLSWQPHVNQICHKANRQLGFLYRNLRGSPKHFTEYAYKQIVLPSIQYCSVIWDPYYQNAIHKVERYSTERLTSFWGNPGVETKETYYPNDIWAELANTLTSYETYSTNFNEYKFLHQHLTIPDYYLPSPLPYPSTRSYDNSKLLHTINPEQIFTSILSIPEWNDLQVLNLQNLTLSQIKNMLQAATVN